jgi:hypothetical protein
MSDVEIQPHEIGAYDRTLVANVTDGVTFVLADPSSGIGRGGPPRMVEIFNDGPGVIYVTTDGSDPAVAGAHCHRIPPGSTILALGDENPDDAVVIKLKSAGTPLYSVARV